MLEARELDLNNDGKLIKRFTNCFDITDAILEVHYL